MTPMSNHNTTMNQNNINHGDYVPVTEDLSPGKNSHGRTGFVVDTQGDGWIRTFTVRYDLSAIDGSLTLGSQASLRLMETKNHVMNTLRHNNFHLTTRKMCQTT